MNPNFNPAHASQTVDESLATRLDPVFQRFQLEGNYTTVEYPEDSSEASLFNSLSKKLNHLLKMSDDDTPNIAHNVSGNIADNGRSGHRQPGPAGETASPDLELASMLKQQHEMLLSCIQEISNLKQEKSAATQRTQLRDSEGTQNFLMAASTSTPQQQMPPQTVAHPSGSYQHDHQAGQQRTSDENARRRNIDLNRWHVKFDGSGKSLTVESFVFRVERLRQQQQISYEELFAEFHCLVTGQASKWYWQLLEDREGDFTFDYFALKAELLNQFKTAYSDYELIREIMERKQQQAESFEDYYAEIHDLTFRLRRKIPEMIKIMNLATLIFATKVESVGEFKAECKRAEKLLKESRSRSKHVTEIDQEGENSDGVHREAVEDLVPRHGPSSDRQRGNSGAVKYDKRWVSTGNTNKHPNERHHLQPTTSRGGQPKQEATAAMVTPQHYTTTPAPAVRAAQSIAFCQSPFHLMICYVCGMPGDFFLRNPAEGSSGNQCSDSASHVNQNELAKRTRIDKNLSSQHSTRRSSMPHPPAATVTTNQHLHQSQKQQQLEHSTPNHRSHQHHRHSVQNQQQLPSAKQPAGNITTDRNFGTDATATATAQHSKCCFQPAPQAYTNQTPANLASSGRSTMINSEFEFSTNTGGRSSNDGSSSRTPFDLATEALRDSRPIDRERLLNLLQTIANENQQYRMQNQLLKGLLDIRNEQIRQLSYEVQFYNIVPVENIGREKLETNNTPRTTLTVDDTGSRAANPGRATQELMSSSTAMGQVPQTTLVIRERATQFGNTVEQPKDSWSGKPFDTTTNPANDSR
ncbi:hypothetical protein GQX74_015571 [Glossina fuscipes]|nr:hypothetical protein GQX74_015571 [Glossina fuscipes]